MNKDLYKITLAKSQKHIQQNYQFISIHSGMEQK